MFSKLKKYVGDSPEEVPAHWEARLDERGAFYYIDTQTGEWYRMNGKHHKRIDTQEKVFLVQAESQRELEEQARELDGLQIDSLRQKVQKLTSDLDKMRKVAKKLLVQNKQLKAQCEAALQSSEEKHDENDNGLQAALVALTRSMDAFNAEYSVNVLSAIYNENHDALFVEQDANAAALSCDSLARNLREIQKYIVSVTRPNVKEYKHWNLKTLMIWINGLEDGHFSKYSDVLRKGFESDGIEAVDVPFITQSDLATTPFDIRVFRDRKKLAECFASLGESNAAKDDEGTVPTAYL